MAQRRIVVSFKGIGGSNHPWVIIMMDEVRIGGIALTFIIDCRFNIFVVTHGKELTNQREKENKSLCDARKVLITREKRS